MIIPFAFFNGGIRKVAAPGPFSLGKCRLSYICFHHCDETLIFNPVCTEFCRRILDRLYYSSENYKTVCSFFAWFMYCVGVNPVCFLNHWLKYCGLFPQPTFSAMV